MTRRAAAALVIACLATPAAGAEPQATGPSGLPLPRFVSLKFDQINVRRGPATTHDVVWTYVKTGLPVEVVQEFDTWRRIRDAEGQEGWVQQSQLVGRRTALVAPWQKSGMTELRSRPGPDGAVLALVEPGVLATIDRCDGKWCKVDVGRYAGFVEQTRLFGVYPGEMVK